MVFLLIVVMFFGMIAGFVGFVNDKYGDGDRHHRNHRRHHNHRW